MDTPAVNAAWDALFLQSLPLFKYPRTPHLEGSRLQDGDDGADQMPLKKLAGQYVVIEEKIDGANAAVSFSDAGMVPAYSTGTDSTGEPASMAWRRAVDKNIWRRRQYTSNSLK